MASPPKGSRAPAGAGSSFDLGAWLAQLSGAPPIVQAGASVLRSRAESVPSSLLATPALRELVGVMTDVMRDAPGVGLAAPQVGIGWRVFSLDVTRHPKARTVHGEYVLVNPRVVSASRNEKGREGCMSVPDLTGDVKRATRIVVEGLLPGTGDKVSIETDAFEARALQHEIDHLDGALFLDRVAGPHALHARKVYLEGGEMPGSSALEPIGNDGCHPRARMRSTSSLVAGSASGRSDVRYW